MLVYEFVGGVLFGVWYAFDSIEVEVWPDPAELISPPKPDEDGDDETETELGINSPSPIR